MSYHVDFERFVLPFVGAPASAPCFYLAGAWAVSRCSTSQSLPHCPCRCFIAWRAPLQTTNATSQGFWLVFIAATLWARVLLLAVVVHCKAPPSCLQGAASRSSSVICLDSRSL